MSTLYENVAQSIMNQIEEGKLRVGDGLPPEAEYAAQLGISRTTLRLAFQKLENQGVLERRKRIGTKIISAKPKRLYSMATTDLNELLNLGRDTKLVLRGTRNVRTEDMPELVGLVSETGHWLEITGVRFMTGEAEPFSVNRVYVPARFAAIEPALKDVETSIFEAIETIFKVKVGRIHQSVTARPCPAPEAELLGLSEHSATLQVQAQLFTEEDELLEVSVATYHPDRFKMNTDLRIAPK